MRFVFAFTIALLAVAMFVPACDDDGGLEDMGAQAVDSGAD